MIATDSFTGSDSATHPTGWSEISGNFGRTSNACTTTDTSAVLRHDTAHPDGESSMWVQAKVKGNTAGDKLRLFAAWEDADDYLVAELELHATCGTLRLFKSVAGVEAQLGSDVPVGPATAGDWHTMTICYRHDTSSFAGGGILHASVSTAAGNLTHFSEDSATGIGTYAAIGTGGTLTSGAAFDDFKFYKGYSTDNPTCPQCTTDRDTCVIFADLFDDASIDCRLEQTSGTWSEASGVITSTGAGELRCLLPADKPDWLVLEEAGMAANVYVSSPAGATSVRILRSSGSAYLEATVTHAASGATLTIKNGATTLASTTLSFATNGASTFVGICYRDGFCSATANNGTTAKTIHADGFTAPTGRYASWVTDGAASFTAVNVGVIGGECGECPYEATCGVCPPGRVVAAVNLIFRAANASGTFTDTLVGTYSLTPTAADGCEWGGTFDVVSPSTGNLTILEITVKLKTTTSHGTAGAWEGDFLEVADTAEILTTSGGTTIEWDDLVAPIDLCDGLYSTTNTANATLQTPDGSLVWPTGQLQLEVIPAS